MRTQKAMKIERRRYPRWGWQARLRGICVDTQGHRVVENLRAVDVSKGGMGVIAQREHAVGEHIVICLPEPQGPDRYVHAKVVRCWQEQGGAHMGMKFSNIPIDMDCWLTERLAA